MVVIDMFEGCIGEESCNSSIPIMPGSTERMEKASALVKKAREAGMPVIVVQERHRKTGTDFGRELDGVEGAHCLEGSDGINPPFNEIGMTDKDYIVVKRRYSAFFKTDIELLLRAHKIETLILVGSNTDVCIHYTFVDAHQNDYYCRVPEDCVYGGSKEAHDASIKAMEYMQEGAIQTYESMLKYVEEYKNR
ncbi:cysteine hydrolase [Clostridium grantii]|nr:cysteine hydrolase [Clostridium grantii]